MKKLLLGCCIFLFFKSSSVLSDVTQDLKNRLEKVNHFHAQFSQTISSNDGTILEYGTGELWIMRPNLFNWHLTSPDESILISDGQTLWFYNPCIEQVTATWVNHTIEKTPFMLFITNNENNWREYHIKQKGDDFTLTPKFKDSNLKHFFITVTNSGVVRSFTAVEKDWKRITYVFKIQKDRSFDITKFKFILPQGVRIDDQRQSITNQ